MLSPIDISLASSAYLEFFGAGSNLSAGRVKFQFPPRITSDGKDIDWAEGPLRGGEPLAYFKTSGARKIRLEWTYMVGETGAGGERGSAKYWTTEDVAKEVSGVRWYFHNIGLSDDVTENIAAGTGAGGADASLIVKFGLWRHGEVNVPFTARMLAVDIKYGKTLFAPLGTPAYTYPLRTDIGVDLRLWTNSRDAEGDKQDLPLMSFYNGHNAWR